MTEEELGKRDSGLRLECLGRREDGKCTLSCCIRGACGRWSAYSMVQQNYPTELQIRVRRPEMRPKELHFFKNAPGGSNVASSQCIGRYNKR